MLFNVATGVYIFQLAIFGFLHGKSNFSPIVRPVSDYGVGSTRRLFVIYGLIGCVATLLLAAAVFFDGRFPLKGCVYLVFVAVLRFGVLLFPTDMVGNKLTRVGKLHYLFAIASFAFLYMAIDVLYPVAVALVAENAATALSAVKMIVTSSLVGVVVCLVPPLRKVFGLVERIYLVSSAVWLMAFSIGVSLSSA